MNNDSSNPFANLNRHFAARKGTKGASGSAGSMDKGNNNDDPGDDASLFLDAVGRINPLSIKKDKTAVSGKAGTRSAPSGFGHLNEKDRGPEFGKLIDTKTNRSAPAPASPQQQPTQNRKNTDLATATATDDSCDPARDDFFAVAAGEHHAQEDCLFAKAMQGVSPISCRGRDVAVPTGQARPGPAHDPAKALRDLLEGRVEFALHHTGEFMEGCVVGTDPRIQARLRAGQYSPEKHLDLHGMTVRQAYEALIWFIRDAYHRGLRCVVVVTGRGKNSPDGVGVLRTMLQRWFGRDPFKRVVLAFCTARPSDGGPGACYVLLRKYKKSWGKIIWEHNFTDIDFIDS